MEAKDIVIPTPNDGVSGMLIHGVYCRVWVRNNVDWTPEVPSNHMVAVVVAGAYGPTIGMAMRTENAWHGKWGFVAKYRDTVSKVPFPDPFDAVKWILDQRKADPERTDNGLRDTNNGRDW